MSKNPFSDFKKPNHNIVGYETLRVPKRAFFGKERIIFAGFSVIAPSWYGGTLHLLEAFQNTDGTLKFCPL